MKRLLTFCSLFVTLIMLTSCTDVVPDVNTTMQPSIQTADTISSAYPTSTEASTIETSDLQLSADNLKHWEVLKTMGMKRVLDFALSPNSNELAFSNQEGVFIYDLETGKTELFDYGEFSWLLPIENIGPDLAYSPDGKYLAIADTSILLSDRVTGEKRVLWVSKFWEDFKPNEIEFTPDSNHLIIHHSGGEPSCDGPSTVISLLDISSETLLYEHRFCSQSSLVYHFFTDDGNVVLVGRVNSADWSSPYTAIKVDINTGKELIYFQPKDLEWNLFSVSHDFSYIVDQPNVTDDSVRLIEFPSEKLVMNYPKKIFHLNQTNFILGQETTENKDTFSILDRELKEICQIKERLSFYLDVYRGPFKVTKQYFVTYHKGYQEIGIWNLDDCSLSWSVPIHTFERGGVDISSDGSKLFHWSYESFSVLDLETGNTIFRKPYSPDYGISYNADYAEDFAAKELYLRTGRKAIEVLDIDTGQTLRTYTIETDKNVADLYFSSDFNIVMFSTLEDRLWHYWDLESATEEHSWIPLAEWNLQFSETRDLLAYFDKREVVLCDPLTWKNCEKYSTFPGYRPFAISDGLDMAIFSRDARSLPLKDGETGSERIVLNLENGKITALDPFPDFSPEISPSNLVVAFSPDLKLLAAISGFSQLLVWDLESGSALQQINLPEGSQKLWFTSDGEKIIVLADGLVYVIGIPSE